MKTEDYIEQSGNTDGDTEFYGKVRERLNTDFNARLFHYISGVVTEAGELEDQLKKHIIYGKPLDLVNLKEEIGDVLWYLARLCKQLDVSFEDIMAVNIKKLRARFPNKFTEQDALNRDLEKERSILEE